MPVTAVVGGHWGDEGKGRLVDALSADADLVIRYNGGSNAGHTIVDARGTFRLHLVPSGILHPDVLCLIGPGAVVNPLVLFQELDELAAAGVDASRLRIAERAHLVFPFHLEEDVLIESLRGKSPHGTTRQGIWPAYADKAARRGLRVGDLYQEEYLRQAVGHLTARKRDVMRVHRRRGPSARDVLRLCAQWRDRLAPYVVDSHGLVRDALGDDAHIVLEGHLGVLRDLDWGLYPYVTSSTCLPGGAAAGAGIPASAITRVIGVVKAYTTVVGSGPMPTELQNATGARLRRLGEEYGARTGRPRRCGWFDAVAARFAAEVAGFTELAVMKLDVLSGFRHVKLCTAYRDGRRLLHHVPHAAVTARVRPHYETVPGWVLDGASSFGALPTAARDFLGRLETLVGVPVTMVGVGAGREALLRRDHARLAEPSRA